MNYMNILIDNRQDKIEISQDIVSLIEKVVEEVLVEEDFTLDCELSISFVDNEEIRDLNRSYRNVDKETDVLSFPMDDDFMEDKLVLLGDIVISMEKALEQAGDLGHSVDREIAYLTAHSMLHLLGYDHIEDHDKKEMRAREKAIMKKLGIFKS